MIEKVKQLTREEFLKALDGEPVILAQAIPTTAIYFLDGIHFVRVYLN